MFLFFVISQFVAYFNFSNIGTLVAVKLAGVLKEANLNSVTLLLAFIVIGFVLARRSENRSVTFVDAHRLVALFFGAMGINEHAKVKIQQA